MTEEIKNSLWVFGLTLSGCLLWSLLLIGASEPPPILRNGFTTNADPPVTLVNTYTNPVPVQLIGSSSNLIGTTNSPVIVSTGTNSLSIGSTNFELHSLSDVAQNVLTNVNVTIVTNGVGGTAVLPLFTTSTGSTNQVSFSVNATNECNNVTSAGTVGNCAWSVTNGVFRSVGGSGLLQSISLRSSTNQDLVVMVFSQVVSAQTSGSALSLTQADMQYLVGCWDTTNTQFRAWQKIGTNWVFNLDRLATPILGTGPNTNIHIIATYLEAAKTNYAANSSYVTTGFINEK